MKTLLALLVLSCATAVAAPNPPTPPAPPTGAPQPACTATGDVVIEIRHRADAQHGSQAQTDAKLFAGGGWTRAETLANGKPGPASSGCLAADQLAKIQTSLANAPWKVEQLAVDCKAISSEATIYTVHGHPPFDDHPCGGERLDGVTYAALTDAAKIVDTATAKVTPPCCKK